MKNLLLRQKELSDRKELEDKKFLLGKNKTTGLSRTMLKKNIAEDKLDTLLHRYEILKKREGLNKENLSLLERGFLEGNEFMKLGKKKKPVDRVVDVDITILKPYDDKFEKIIHYTDKYKIPYHENGSKKSYKQLAHDIHAFEMKHLKELVKKGVNNKYNEYGHYINVV